MKCCSRRVQRDDSAKDYTLAHVMLIYDEPLLSGQPPLTGHLPVSRGQNRFITEVQLVFQR